MWLEKVGKMQGFCVLNTGVMSCWSVVCRYGYKKKAKNGLLTKGTLRLEAAFIGLAFVAMVLQNSFEQRNMAFSYWL